MSELHLAHDPILATKLFIPRAVHTLIPRSALTSILDQNEQRPLTLVSAPAGFGKTTLIAGWLRGREVAEPPSALPDTARLKMAWLSLEDSDNQLTRFWTYVFTALDRCRPGLATALLSYLEAQQPPSFTYLLTALINALVDSDEQILLVLDDYHVITAPAIHDTLIFLLDRLPINLRLMLLTRADPPLPLARLRARGQVLELRTEQLRCSEEEVDRFLREVMQIRLSSTQVREVASRTEGWLVGLQLLGLWLQAGNDPGSALAELSGAQHFILDYLTDEVLRQQPEDIQTFLLHTSILDELCADVCDAVLGQSGSQATLEYLARTNLFLMPLDAQRRWYRYHQLFAEALPKRLELQDAMLLSSLRLRASHWYAAQSQIDQAASYALQAHAWPQAADLIIRMYSQLGRGIGQRRHLRPWLEQLPDTVIRAQPLLALATAQTQVFTAPPATTMAWLDAAEQSAATAEGDDMLGAISATRALLLAAFGDSAGALAQADQALALLPQQNRTERANVAYAQCLAYAALGDLVAAGERAHEAAALAEAEGQSASAVLYLGNAADCLIAQGRLHDAFQLLEQAIRLGEAPGGLRVGTICLAFILQADILCQWNQVEAAALRLQEGLRLNDMLGSGFGRQAYTVLARIETGRADLPAALAALEQADQAASAITRAMERAHFVVDQVRLWLAQGDIAQAKRRVEEIAAQRTDMSRLLSDRIALAGAWVMLAEGRADAALAQLEPLLARLTELQRWGDVIVLRIAQALAHRQRQDEAQALKALAKAVRLAEPAGYIRIFADQGVPLARLLAQLRDQQHAGSTAYLDVLLAAFPSATEIVPNPAVTVSQHAALGPQQSALVEPLSTRELEVLQLLARGAANQEIATALVITINTAKRHVGNIMAKLEVTNRTQAVARARKLGLLSDEP